MPANDDRKMLLALRTYTSAHGSGASERWVPSVAQTCANPAWRVCWPTIAVACRLPCTWLCGTRGGGLMVLSCAGCRCLAQHHAASNASSCADPLLLNGLEGQLRSGCTPGPAGNSTPSAAPPELTSVAILLLCSTSAERRRQGGGQTGSSRVSSSASWITRLGAIRG